VDRLGRALTRWEPPSQPGEQVREAGGSRNGVALVCSCTPPRKIRLRGNPETIDTSRIRCEICGELFVPVMTPGS